MRILGQTLTVATAAALAFFVAPACVENDQSIFIRSALAPSATRVNGSCTYTSDITQAILFEGLVDVAVTDSYTAIMLVGSQLIPRADPLMPRAESNRAHINGAIVRVTDANGNPFGEFTSLSQGFIDPALGPIASYSPVAVVAIDAPTLQKAAAGLAPGQTRLVLSTMKAFGETLGGVDLESGEFQMPIRVCNRCLVSFETGDDPLTAGVDCNLSTTAAGAGAGAARVVPCQLGQDEAVPCELCRDSKEACRTTAPNP